MSAESAPEAGAGLSFLSWPAFDAHPVDVVVTTREGGVSVGPYASLNLGLHVGDEPGAVVENRRRVAAGLGVSLTDMVFCRQTHGRGVAVVGRAEAGRGAVDEGDALDGIDALVTAEPGVALVMMAADCSPIAMYDPAARVVACVHSGWRGTVARVTEAALEAMVGLGASVPRVVAAIGPTVPGASYQVGEEVVAAAAAAFGDVNGLAAPDGTGRWTFDLVAANRRLLVSAGVPAANVMGCGRDTFSPEFYSDRSERPCGRHAVIAVLRN